MADLFLSYSRRDSEFVRKLADALTDKGKDVWVDVEGIRDAEVFPAALRRAVEQSDGFVFVISPDSVDSEFCEQEVSHAVELGKRIVPLALRRVPDDEIPEPIRERHWIPFDSEADFTNGVDRLVTALDTDLDHVRAHTRWLVKALDWEARNRDRAMLVRGSELADSEQWIQQGAGKDPEPTPLQYEYVYASRAAAARRLRVLVGAMGIALAVAIALAVVALSQRNEARHQTKTARSRELASVSERQQTVDPQLAILLAIQAVKTQATPEAMFALRSALDASPVLESYRHKSGFPFSLAFSPDGRMLAFAAPEGRDGVVRVLDSRTSRPLYALYPGGRADRTHAPGQVPSLGSQVPLPNSVTFTPEGNTLAVGLDSGGVALYDAHSGKFLRRLGGPDDHINTVAFSAGGKRMVTAGLGQPKLWDLASGRVLLSLPLPSGNGSDAAITADGRWIAASSFDSRLLVVDTRTGRSRIDRTGRFALGLDFSPTAPELATVAGQSLLIVDVPSGRTRVLAKFPTAQSNDVRWSPDGKRVAVALSDGTAMVWDAQTGELLRREVGHRCCVISVAFSPDGKRLATGSLDRTVQVSAADDKARARTQAGGRVAGLAFAGDNLGVAARAAPALLWQTGTRALPLSRVRSAAGVAANGTLLAFAGPGAAYTLIDGSGRSAPRVVDTALTARDIEFDRSGKRLLLAATSGLTIFDAASGKSLEEASNGNTVTQAAFQPGRHAVAETLGRAGEENPTLQLLRLPSHDVAWSKHSTDPYLALAFSPDGSVVAASAKADRAVRLFDSSTGRQLRELIGHSGDIDGVAFSRDGRFIATAGLDNTVRVWNARTGDQLRELQQRRPVSAVAFSADGRTLALGDYDGTVELWDACPGCLDPTKLLALAQPQVTRRLTPLERRTFHVGG